MMNSEQSPQAGPDINSDSRMALSEMLLHLMRRYQQADAAAADELVARVNPILARYYYALTGNPRIVEDLLQDCWLRIHRARQSYRPGDPVLPWILAIARHTRVDQYRRWKRSSGRESSIDAMAQHPSSDPRSTMETRLEANSILAVMERIPESQREILMMLKVSGMSVEEVARATGSSSAAVKQKAYRAYQAVRRALGLKQEQGEESDDVHRR
ncbi:MAG: RNA polymerase sigma factor [Acidobacteria bacterium]|nr:RNA polymerase sigma factor [Acidobacteriota bacterium]